ncbi:hypothetical protein [Membranihabitans maritimus]|uniref:hypothetical protein n=1 Tax=Membranihabitans maritimus TaxID=2904244 RepID=UPI001F2178AD|nr:hypothetical protein [Membranihabitans maritimus]
MKNIKLFALALLSVFFFSCEKDADIVESTITYLPKFETEGPDYIELTCQEDFEEPATSAFEGGNEIPVNRTVNGVYFGANEVSIPDQYIINYSATNVDSIPGAYMREVLKYPCSGDLQSDISGVYTSTVARVTGDVQTGMTNIFIVQTSENTYLLSNGAGAYYDKGADWAYGSDYSAKGAVITVNDLSTNDITVSSAAFPLWGYVMDITDFKVDPASKTITFHSKNADIASLDFQVTLTQVQ